MFENGKRPHITVVGDLILDRYLIGDATKLNPEQPGVVIRVEKEEGRLGGAAAAAMITARFGARVTLAGVVGRDEAGRCLQQLIATHGIEPHLWIDDRPTTWKQRIVARGQLRPDRYDREVTGPIGDRAAQFLSTVPIGDMVLISDYDKGVCTQSLLQTVGDRARAAGVPILVDPARGRDFFDYGHVTLIKANWEEARLASRGHEVRPLALASYLAGKHNCRVVVTMGRCGIACAWPDGECSYLPAEPTAVKDVCGAGDTVLAALAVSISSGKTIYEPARFAARAAARQVSSNGISANPAPRDTALGTLPGQLSPPDRHNRCDLLPARFPKILSDFGK